MWESKKRGNLGYGSDFIPKERSNHVVKDFAPTFILVEHREKDLTTKHVARPTTQGLADERTYEWCFREISALAGCGIFSILYA